MPDVGTDEAVVAYVALGSNLGDRARYLAAGRDALAALPGTTLVAASDIEETEPLGPPDQPLFLNQVVAIRTTLDATALLERLHAIERANDRVRSVRWGPRTLDLDIIAFGDERIQQPDLVVPHPELPHRPFWRRELQQVRDRLGAQVGGPRA